MKMNHFSFRSRGVNSGHSSKLPLYFLLMVTLLSFSCKKSNDSPQPPVAAKSQWTFNGVTYKVTDAAYVDDPTGLVASDDAGVAGGGNYVRIFLGAATRPTASATLTVEEYGVPGNPTTCSIQVGNLYDPTYPGGYLSTGKSGDKVILTVSSSGKLSASFTNITVLPLVGGSPKTVSGVLVQN